MPSSSSSTCGVRGPRVRRHRPSEQVWGLDEVVVDRDQGLKRRGRRFRFVPECDCSDFDVRRIRAGARFRRSFIEHVRLPGAVGVSARAHHLSPHGPRVFAVVHDDRAVHDVACTPTDAAERSSLGGGRLSSAQCPTFSRPSGIEINTSADAARKQPPRVHARAVRPARCHQRNCRFEPQSFTCSTTS